MNMEFEKKLAIPMEVKEMYPISSGSADIVERRNIEMKEILSGRDDRMLLIGGPRGCRDRLYIKAPQSSGDRQGQDNDRSASIHQ